MSKHPAPGFARLKIWFYRVAAVQFVVTALTGLLLYLRPLDDRAGFYSKGVKEWLVMLHNGEWLGFVLFGNRYVSGLLIGAVLAVLVSRLALRTLRRPGAPP